MNPIPGEMPIRRQPLSGGGAGANPTVSIIVPVYNGEETLNRCLDSILNQTFQNWELLLMDDGSTDGSPALCDAYARQDSRIQVEHKANSGVADTRNQGIALARGTYLQFVDCDDWLTSDATALLVETAERQKADLVISDFYRVIGSRVSRKGEIRATTPMTRQEFAALMMKKPASFYYGVLWNKLYRREIIQSHELGMNPEISWCEDFMFNLEYIRWAEVFAALQVPVYYYVKTKNSLVKQNATISGSIRMKQMVFYYYNKFYRDILTEEDYQRNRLKIYRFLVDAATDGSVAPGFLSNARRLGQERLDVDPETLSGNGTLADSYRRRKLLEHYLEPMALRYELQPGEAWLLLCLSRSSHLCSRRSLAEYAGVTTQALSRGLQRFAARGWVRTEERRPPRQSQTPGERPSKSLTLEFLPAAQPVLKDLDHAQAAYEKALLSNLTAEEQAEYLRLNQKLQDGIRRLL